MLLPTLLVSCFAVGLMGVVLARTDGSGLYVAFCALSPVLLPIWIGMQVGDWLTNSGKKYAHASPAKAKRSSRIAFARPSRVMAGQSNCVAPATQH